MALVAYLAVTVFALRKHWKLLAGTLAAIVAVTLVVLLAGGDDEFSQVWLRRGLSFRDQIWRATLSAYAECSAMFGCGLTTPLHIEVPHNIATRAHSIFIAALYHQGVVGLLIFVGTAIWLLGRAGPGPAEADPNSWTLIFALALLANLTSGDHVLVRSSLFWAYFWLPAMVLAATAGRNSTTRSRAGASP